MKIISLNIEHHLHDPLVFEFLKKENADVICIQELLPEKLDFYKEKLNLSAVYQLLDYELVLPELMGKHQGIAIFAKNIIASGSTFFWGKEENLSKPFDQFLADPNLQKNVAFLWADIKDESGAEFKVITTHLPVTKQGEVTSFQLEVIDSLLEKLSPLHEFIFCGDTNAPRGREAFGRLAKKYKDNIPLKYKTSIDQNLHRAKGIQFMVDGLFTTPRYIALNVKLIDGVSDHMAIVAEVTLNQ